MRVAISYGTSQSKLLRIVRRHALFHSEISFHAVVEEERERENGKKREELLFYVCACALSPVKLMASIKCRVM